MSAAEREGAADPQANAAAVADGLVSSGGGWQITTDPKTLNDDSFINGIKDNTANAAFTQILPDGRRPGNGNLRCIPGHAQGLVGSAVPLRHFQNPTP